MKIKRWLLLIAVLLCTTPLTGTAAEPKTADEVLGAVTKKLEQTKSWSSDFKQSMNMLGAELSFSGKIYFQQPNLMRMEMNMPMMGVEGKMLMIIDADMWSWQQIEFGPQKQYIKMNMAKVMSNNLAQAGAGADADPLKAMNPARSWEQTKQFYNYQLLPAADINGEPVWVIEGTWKESALTNKLVGAQAQVFGKSRLSISQKTGLVIKTEQFDKANEQVVIAMEFSNQKLNPELAADLFRLQLPAEAQVLDMTEMAGQLGSNPFGGLGGAPRKAQPAPTP